jgi:hypothetical protein
MACPSYGSSSEVALFYCLDPDPAADLPAATTFMPIPYTGESLDASLSSTVSEQITPQRSYANSKLSQGEVGGSISFEASPGEFLENMLLATLQVNKAMMEPGDVRGASNWEGAAAIKNASTKHCLAILKRVQNAAGNYDLYLYRGCQIDSLSLNMEPGNLITGDINVMGVGLGNPVAGTAVWENIAAGVAPLDQWDLSNTSFGTGNLLSGVDSLLDFTLTNSGGDMGIVAQSVSLTLSNQLRQQYGLGSGSIYAVGVASGRFMATLSVSAYYSNPKIFSSFTGDDEIATTFGLKDSTDLGFSFEFNKCKITSGSNPLAGGPDQDLLIATELQAFEDATDGTVKITLDLVAA